MSNATNAPVTLYHNPNCSKSRGALELLQALTHRHGLPLVVVEYLQTPLGKSELQKLLAQLSGSAAELVRNDKNFKALNLDASHYQSPEQVIELLREHPELMQRPVAVYQGQALIGRPPENLQALFV